MRPTHIVVVGSANVDLIAQVAHLPKPGETVGNASFAQAFGGKGANQAVAARRAGGQVSLISCLGSDLFGQNMLQSLSAEGINTEHVFIDEKKPTGTALILVDAQGENCIAVAPGANYSLTPAAIDEARFLISGAEYILLQMEIPLDTVRYMLELAASLGKKVLLNTAPAYPLDHSYFKYLHLLVMNKTEAEIMTGIRAEGRDGVVSAAEEALRRGADSVVITLGGQGAFYAGRREKKWIEPFPVQAVDTTAAGDVFCGALAAALSKNSKPAEALRFASAAAAVSVTRFGAQPAAPAEAEIREFLDRYDF